MDQALRRRGQHNPGQVVVAEHGGLFVSTGRDDHGTGAHLGNAIRFHQRHPVVGVIAGGEGVGEHAYFRLRLNAGKEIGFPVRAAAQPGVLIDQYDVRTLLRRRQRGTHSGESATDHQHIAKAVTFRRAPARGGDVDLAQASGVAEQLLPQGKQSLAVKGLVVEAHRQEARETAEDAGGVLVQRAEGIHRRQFHAGHQQRGVGAHIRHAAGLHQGIDVMVGGGKDAARTVVLEGAAEDLDAIGPQGTGNRVTFETFVVTAFEAEAQRLAACDPFAGLNRQAHHTSPA